MCCDLREMKAPRKSAILQTGELQYRTGSPCAGAEHNCTPTSWNPPTTGRIRGLCLTGPLSSLHLNRVWPQPPPTQITLYDHLITPPSFTLYRQMHSSYTSTAVIVSADKEDKPALCCSQPVYRYFLSSPPLPLKTA